jgi:hypothetical protein
MKGFECKQWQFFWDKSLIMHQVPFVRQSCGRTMSRNTSWSQNVWDKATSNVLTKNSHSFLDRCPPKIISFSDFPIARKRMAIPTLDRLAGSTSFTLQWLLVHGLFHTSRYTHRPLCHVTSPACASTKTFIRLTPLSSFVLPFRQVYPFVRTIWWGERGAKKRGIRRLEKFAQRIASWFILFTEHQ